jgi:uncharacterized protein (DUF433 family)
VCNTATILDRLPFYTVPSSVVLPDGSVSIKSYQIIVWVSLSARDGEAPHRPAFRFPAILDTAHSHNFSIQESHLIQWAGLRLRDLPEIGRARVSGIGVSAQPVSLFAAHLWLHRNRPGNGTSLPIDHPSAWDSMGECSCIRAMCPTGRDCLFWGCVPWSATTFISPSMAIVGISRSARGAGGFSADKPAGDQRLPHVALRPIVSRRKHRLHKAAVSSAPGPGPVPLYWQTAGNGTIPSGLPRRERDMNLPEFLTEVPGNDIRLTGHRISLYHLVEDFNAGYSAEKLSEEFPTLCLSLIQKVLAFYQENRAEVDEWGAKCKAEIEQRLANPAHVLDIEALKRRNPELTERLSKLLGLK